MDRLKHILSERLEAQGLRSKDIPSFVRDLLNVLEVMPSRSLSEINERLRLMGWYYVNLDDHTLQLILATSSENPEPQEPQPF